MKVRITKCSDGFWYSKHIGEIIEVTDYLGDYEVIDWQRYDDGSREDLCGLWIYKEDCEEATMEQTKKFKVGDEVVGTGRATWSCKVRGVVTAVLDGDEYNVNFEGYEFPCETCLPWHEDELELAEPKEQWLTKEEALKAAIDGKTVVDNEGTQYTFDSSSGQFWFKREGCTASSQLSQKYNGSNPLTFKIYQAPPKFNIGQFIVDSDNDYARIVSMEYKDNQWNYSVHITADGCPFNFTESQLSEVPNIG